jgi:hypothetical protein
MGVNTLAYNQINSNNFAYTGIVYTNFYGDDLLKLVLGRNTKIYAMCTTTQRNHGCALCSLAGVCTQCITQLNYVYNSTTTTCFAAPGYYLNSSSFPILCYSTIPGCLLCNSATVCTSCDTVNNYVLNPNTTLCDAAPGYYLNVNSTPVICP